MLTINLSMNFGSSSIADSTEELLTMADQIGGARRWLQKPGTYLEHFDICLTKRALAEKHGAAEITMRELGKKLRERRTELRRHVFSVAPGQHPS